jgi:hypothetical protein
MELKDLNLKHNPFKDLTPDINDTSLVWGGMDEIKSRLEKCYLDCVNNNSKQIVLNWGPYGGGKTFSAYYFSHKEGATDNLTHVYIRSPKNGAKATDEFFKSIIDCLTFDLIREQVKGIIKQNGDKALIEYLTPKSTREFAKAICLAGSEDEDIAEIMGRFFYLGITLNELKKLGLSKRIQSDSDRVKILAGIISCFIGNENLIDGRVVLWIDEMEDLIYYSPKYYKSFSQVLRDLFDSMPDRFLTFMNFTLAEGQENTIELILGGAIWSRITKKIRYKEFSYDHALSYCNDLLHSAKIKKSSNKPFIPDLLKELINNIPNDNLTPREINRHITSLLNYCLEHNCSEITQDVFNGWTLEFVEDN